MKHSCDKMLQIMLYLNKKHRRKDMKKIVITTIIFTLLILIQSPLVQADSFDQTKPTNLYFYKKDIEEFCLKTEKPSSSSDDFVETPIGANHLEIDFTTDTLTTIYIQGNFSFEVWISCDVLCMIEFILNLQVYYDSTNNWEDVAGFYRRTSVEGESKLSGSKTLGQDLSLTDGDRLCVNIILNADGYSAKLLFGSEEHPSHITLDTIPIYISIDSDINLNSETVVFRGIIKDAFGHDDIVLINSELSGPVPLINIVGPTRTDQKNEIHLDWIWDYEKDNAVNGTYNIYIECTDSNGNTWDYSEGLSLNFGDNYQNENNGGINNDSNDEDENNREEESIKGFETLFVLIAICIVILLRKSKNTTRR